MLARASVGCPVVTGTVRESDGTTATLELEAEQAGSKIIRNGEAEITVS